MNRGILVVNDLQFYKKVLTYFANIFSLKNVNLTRHKSFSLEVPCIAPAIARQARY